MPMTRTIRCRVDNDLYEQMQSYCFWKHIPLSHLQREAIRFYMRKKPAR